MKTSQFKQLLIDAGCLLYREGKRHEVWINPKTGAIGMVGRHNGKEMPTGTARKILRTLGLE